MKTELERYKEAFRVAMGCLAPFSNAYKEACVECRAILNPPPEMEEVEVSSWAIIAPSGFIETTSTNEGLQRDQVGNPNSPFYGYQVAKLTGTYKRPKPQPVERSTEVTLYENGTWRFHGGKHPVKGASQRGNFTWTEEP